MITDVSKARAHHGTVVVPGDKSASHRALILSAMSSGTSSVRGINEGADVLATAQALRQMGAEISPIEQIVTVSGPIEGLHQADSELDLGNSGTAMRLIAGVVSGIPGRHVLVGDESLMRRPMSRIGEPLRLMGADFEGVGRNETAPLRIGGNKSLHGIDYHIPVASAQVKSAILLAGLTADSETRVHEEVKTRTTTEDMLIRSGIYLETLDEGQGRCVVLRPGRPSPQDWLIPGDPSQAAFFIVLGLLSQDGDVLVPNVDLSPERRGFVDVLLRMGGGIQIGDSVTSLRATTSALLSTDIHSSEIPSVDEVPVLVVAAAAATGVTRFIDMDELRHKESDRFGGAVTLARLLGCKVDVSGNTFSVEGLGSPQGFEPFSIDANLDHRFVMSAAVAGSVGQGASISGSETVSTSYPSFFEDLKALSL